MSEKIKSLSIDNFISQFDRVEGTSAIVKGVFEKTTGVQRISEIVDNMKDYPPETREAVELFGTFLASLETAQHGKGRMDMNSQLAQSTFHKLLDTYQQIAFSVNTNLGPTQIKIEQNNNDSQRILRINLTELQEFPMISLRD